DMKACLNNRSSRHKPALISCHPTDVTMKFEPTRVGCHGATKMGSAVRLFQNGSSGRESAPISNEIPGIVSRLTSAATPLTPALCRRERENCRQPVGKSCVAGNFMGNESLFPLPRGEGQGEGGSKVPFSVRT